VGYEVNEGYCEMAAASAGRCRRALTLRLMWGIHFVCFAYFVRESGDLHDNGIRDCAAHGPLQDSETGWHSARNA